METAELKRFAQRARRQLLDQVGARLEQVLRTDSVELREKQAVVDELQEQIGNSSKEAVIDCVAYTWFNRFCALRYMDVNHYSRVGIVSPTEGFTQPEILQEAKQGVFDESLKVDKERVLGLLQGNIPSANPQQEAYRLLLVGACNAYHDRMPFLFEEIEDYTELLMPDDLLSEKSVLQGMREALTPEACQDVEVIGWLYQHYISERKDEVFADLKKNKKIQSEDIPAATQLFTPHWIVRYLVENSLGRLWMLNHPESKLVEAMEYYIRPEQEVLEFLKIGSPEEIKVCDPACGSGHMLTYAFDLLYAIYAEQGYDPLEIPSLILTNNLFGIEIDERAGDLSAFALMMKARAKDKGFFGRGVEPNVCVLENVEFTEDELDRYMEAVGRDLFTLELQETLTQFEQAKNFGSLIQPKVKEASSIQEQIEEQGIFEDLFLHTTNAKVIRVLEQVEYLSSQYHVLVTNPPYMGRGNMNMRLKELIDDYYPMSKHDLFSAFIYRLVTESRDSAFIGMITMQSWMFLPAFEELRKIILARKTILTMAHFGPNAFDTISGEIVSTTAFILCNQRDTSSEGIYFRLIDGENEAEKRECLISQISSIAGVDVKKYFVVGNEDFSEIPGSPLAYWIEDSILESFKKAKASISDLTISDGQTKTGDNTQFLRNHWEVGRKNVGVEKKWRLHPKGGSFRRWYGNVEWVINWSAQAREHYRSDRVARILPEYLWDRRGVSWTLITSLNPSFRVLEKDHIFNLGAPSLFFRDDTQLEIVLGLLNTIFATKILRLLNPTTNLNIGDIQNIPIHANLEEFTDEIHALVLRCIEISRDDWNSIETSWEYERNIFLDDDRCKGNLREIYSRIRSIWDGRTRELNNLELKINSLISKAYDINERKHYTIPVSEVSLFRNPHYRYPDKSHIEYSQETRNAMLQKETSTEFISYAIGCMFGRYSVDKPGVILANQDGTVGDYLKHAPSPSFVPDEDNVIPILDEGWFADDITERFKDFLRVTFGEDYYEENIAFLEEAIGWDIRSYFLKEFYKEHVKMYKKRPIYWLFSSPGSSFNALIYMHRYRPETVSVILNDYLRVFRQKLNANKAHVEEIERSPGASSAEKTKALKEIDQLNGILNEIQEYEDEILYPLATQKIEIDLDDGVLVNYKKFGKALKYVKGLS